MKTLTDEQIALLEANALSLKEAQKTYEENKLYLKKNFGSFSDYEQEQDIETIYILLEIIFPEEYEELFKYFYKSHDVMIEDFSIDDKEQKKKYLCSYLAFDNDFYVRATNWCAFLKFYNKFKQIEHW